MFKKITGFLLTLCLAAGLTVMPVLAAEDAAPPEEIAGPVDTIAPADIAGSVDTDFLSSNAVTIRIESSLQGEEKTLLKTTAVPLLAGATTVTDVLNAVVEGQTEFTESEYGSFLSGIMGVTDETGVYSWMFAVNNEVPEVGMDAYELNDGDEVVFYFISWENADYAYFTPGSAVVTDGESVTLNLTGVDFMEGAYPVEGAQLIITSDAPTTRDIQYTDAEGNVTLSFMGVGEYEISAALPNEAGIQTLSRPYAIITVDEAADAPADLPPETTTDGGLEEIPADLPPETTTDGGLEEIPAETTPEAEIPAGEVPVIPEDIEPMPMPTPPVEYDENNNRLTVYGVNVDITGLQVVSENNELYLPLRAVAEALGLTVTWDSAASTAVIGVPGAGEIRLNAVQALNNGEIKFIENHIYVPSAYVISNYDALR
jgi:hypothetical protein